MVRFQGKRGAIELSMNTIIIVVIGITLLTLGLRWIYNIFGGLEDTQTKLSELTDNKISEIFGESGEAINIQLKEIKISQGEKHNIPVALRNIYDNTHRFRYDVLVDGVPPSTKENIVLTKINWYKKEFTLSSGKGIEDYISIDTKGLPLGEYRSRVVLKCIDCIPVEEETTPIILDIIP